MLRFFRRNVINGLNKTLGQSNWRIFDGTHFSCFAHPYIIIYDYPNNSWWESNITRVYALVCKRRYELYVYIAILFTRHATILSSIFVNIVSRLIYMILLRFTTCETNISHKGIIYSVIYTCIFSMMREKSITSAHTLSQNSGSLELMD